MLDKKNRVFSCFAVNFSHGQLLPSALNKPKFTLYQKTKDRTKKRRVMVRIHV